MKTLSILSVSLAAFGLAWAQKPEEPAAVPSDDRATAEAPSTPAPKTPAERAISAAQRGLAENPDSPRLHNALAYAYARRGRETAEPAWYARADEALARSLELAPENFEARKLQVWNLLGVHEFAQAREAAGELQRFAPDDVMVYGLLVDACVELGDYPAAEEACQWMLDLRPGNVPGLLRTSYLRELFGDVEGAVEVMLEAYSSIRATETEDRAWVLTHLAHLERSRGRIELAGAHAEAALELFPRYHYALAELAAVRSAQGDQQAAVAALRERYAVAPHPENLYELAVALMESGAEDEARTSFASFEEDALAESKNLDNANRELIAYWLEHGARPADALGLAREAASTRRDVRTLLVLARALAANGEHAEAWTVASELLAIGWRDADALQHCGRIAAAAGEAERARALFEESLAANPRATRAPEARAALAQQPLR